MRIGCTTGYVGLAVFTSALASVNAESEDFNFEFGRKTVVAHKHQPEQEIDM